MGLIENNPDFDKSLPCCVCKWLFLSSMETQRIFIDLNKPSIISNSGGIVRSGSIMTMLGLCVSAKLKVSVRSLACPITDIPGHALNEDFSRVAVSERGIASKTRIISISSSFLN